GVTKATDQELSAWAAQAAVKADLGAAGAIRANVLYASGDSGNNARKSKAWQSLNSSSGANNTFGISSNSYYDSKMLLLMRNIVNMDADKAMVYTINNGNQGVTLGVLGYDATFSPKLGASFNVGYAMASNKYKTTADKSLGTELNAQVDYKLFPNLTNSIMAAYVVLGDHYKGTGTGITAGSSSMPANPYLVGYMLNYTF
ncbi:MAG: hypothetical protein PHD54_06290, partial [Desulfuromonadaceae bacterium]|nr:hypothetical protein [Desulfuromonadaceae bacterium]